MIYLLYPENNPDQHQVIVAEVLTDAIKQVHLPLGYIYDWHASRPGWTVLSHPDGHPKHILEKKGGALDDRRRLLAIQ